MLNLRNFRYLFFADWVDSPTTAGRSTRAKIERSKLDGGERKSLIGRGIHWPNGLSVDYANEWLYWCDAYYDKIERVRFNGADRQVLVHLSFADRANIVSLFFSGFNAIYWLRSLILLIRSSRSIWKYVTYCTKFHAGPASLQKTLDDI